MNKRLNNQDFADMRSEARQSADKLSGYCGEEEGCSPTVSFASFEEKACSQNIVVA